MQKRFAVLLAVVMLTACRQYGVGSEQKLNGITLAVVTSFDETDGNREAYEAAVRKFEEDSGVVVNDQSTKSDENWKKEVIDDFNRGNIPDVVFFFKNVPEIVGKSVSVDTIRDSYPTYAESINAAVLNDMKGKDGKAYAIPVTGFWESMFINQSLFKDNGIEVPTDYDMLLRAIERFQELSIIPIAASISQEPHYLFEFLIYNRSGPAGHRAVPVAEDQVFARWEEGLNDFRVLYERGAFPPDLDITHNQALELFQQKKAAMFVDGSWRVGSIADTDDVIVIPFPGTNMRKSTDLLGGFSMGFHITQAGWDNKRDAAVAFVQAMCGKEAGAAFNVNGAASPIPSVGEDGASNLSRSIMEMNKEATAIVPAVQDGFDPKGREALFNDIKKIALGEKTPGEVIKQFIALNKQ